MKKDCSTRSGSSKSAFADRPRATITTSSPTTATCGVANVEEFFEIGVDAVIAEARRVVGDGPTYVSLDVDGLDPVYAPGTGTQEVGGYTTHNAQRMLRGLSGYNLVGGDVFKIFPPLDPSRNTALVGATLMF